MATQKNKKNWPREFRTKTHHEGSGWSQLQLAAMVQSLKPWLVEKVEGHKEAHGLMFVFNQIRENGPVQIKKVNVAFVSGRVGWF